MKDQKIMLESLINYCPHAFFFCGLGEKFLFANPSAYKLYLYNDGELLNQNVDIFNSKETLQTDEIVNAIKKNGIWSGELIQRKKDDSNFYAELTVTLVLHGGIPIGLSSYSRNISDIKESQIKLKEQQIMLTSTAKFSAVGLMTDGIAHEINNHLAIIKAKADKLISKVSAKKIDNDKIFFEIKDIDNTIERITKIVHGLKLISRDSEYDPIEDVLIINIIQDTLNLCKEKFKFGGIEFKISTKLPDETIVLGRSSQLSQVLLNLLNNAFDAIKEDDEKWLSIVIEASGEYALIKEENSFPKINEEIIDKTMDPFFATKAVVLLTGVGLSVSKRIVKKFNGELYLDQCAKHTIFCMKILLKENS
jgi:PAS domain S-box-containing protein